MMEQRLKICQDWIIEEARNIRSLQYGGSFIQVVYRKLDSELVNGLVEIINVIDQNFNTNFLKKDLEKDDSTTYHEKVDQPVQELWLYIFEHSINWTESNSITTVSMMTGLSAEFDQFPRLTSLTSPLFPFSFFIISQIEVEYQNTVPRGLST